MWVGQEGFKEATGLLQPAYIWGRDVAPPLGMCVICCWSKPGLQEPPSQPTVLRTPPHPTSVGAVQLHLVLHRQAHAQGLQLHLEPGGGQCAGVRVGGWE